MKIQDLVDGHLKEENDKPRIRSGCISPSSLGRCYRYQIWYRADLKPSNPPVERDLRVFKIGNIIHEWIQGYFKDEQVEVLCEEEDVKGYCDMVLGDTVYDIKSQHSGSFHYMNAVGDDVFNDKFQNWLQLLFYAKHLKKERMQLVFVSKDDACMKEYNLEVKKYLTYLEKELSTLREMWVRYKEDGVIPNGIPKAYGGKECRYCQFASRCVAISDTKHPVRMEIEKLNSSTRKLTKAQQSNLLKLENIVFVADKLYNKGEIV
jgi:CRISPR/Cas system-associated exonuclease Cas4 (RecB family)